MERFGNSALHFPLSRRSDNADGLLRQLAAPKSDLSRRSTAETDVGGSETKTDLSRRSRTKAEALVSVLGKFGGADQLRNAVKVINHLSDEEMKVFPSTHHVE
jgi:hypothetical protein